MFTNKKNYLQQIICFTAVESILVKEAQVELIKLALLSNSGAFTPVTNSLESQHKVTEDLAILDTILQERSISEQPRLLSVLIIACPTLQLSNSTSSALCLNTAEFPPVPAALYAQTPNEKITINKIPIRKYNHLFVKLICILTLFFIRSY